MSISVTLNFASESELVAFFSGKKAVLQAPVEQPQKDKAEAKKPATADTPSTAKVEAAAAPSEKPSSSAQATTPAAGATSARSDSGASVDRAAVSAAIVKLAVKDKARVIEILAGFGVKAGKELKDEQLADCYAQVSAALEA